MASAADNSCWKDFGQHWRKLHGILVNNIAIDVQKDSLLLEIASMWRAAIA